MTSSGAIRAAVVFVAGLAAAAGLALAAADVPASGAVEKFQLEGSEVMIFNLAGDVTIEPGEGTFTVVEIARGGADAARLKVRQTLEDYRQYLQVVYPTEHVVYAAAGPTPAPVFVDSEGKFGPGYNGAKVTIAAAGPGLDAYANLRIRVPQNKDLTLRLGAGAITVRDVNCLLHIQNFNGAVQAAGVSGSLWVRTIAGSVSVENATGKKLDIESASGDIRLAGVRSPKTVARTDSGKIAIAVAQDIGAQLNVRTQKGRIASQFELPLADEQRQLRGKVGAGATKIDVESASGDIEFREVGFTDSSRIERNEP